MKVNITSVSIILFVLSLGFSLSGYAQTSDSNTDQHQVTVVIPTVALLDLETSGTKNIGASFAAPTEAGDKIAAPADNTTLWLNYSSIQTGTKTKRVEVETSALVDGIDINVSAGSAASGVGTLGTPEAAFNLTVAPKKLIDGIGSAYTISGATKGHQLTYAFVSADANYGNVRSGSTTVTVKYTLLEN